MMARARRPQHGARQRAAGTVFGAGGWAAIWRAGVVGAGFVGVVVLAACGNGGSASIDGAPVVDGRNVDGPGGGPGLAGLLIGPDEQALANVDVLACQATTCLYGESGADGRFAFVLEPPARVALKTHADLTQVPRLAAALVPVAIVDDTLVDTGRLYAPDLPAGAVIGPDTADPQTLDAGDGLELTLRRADLSAPIGDFLYDVAARLLPPQHVPAYLELGDEQVVAVYAMHPFAARSSSPIGVRAPADLPDGTAVWFRTISELDGTFSDPVAGQAGGGYVATDAGTGIMRITYLVISR
jgi:hypothetical protein